MFKGVDFFPHGTKIPVMEWRRFCVSLSLIATVLAIALLSTKGLNFGIDFKGGSLFEIQTKSGNVDIAELRSRLGELDLGEVQIQGLDEPTDALIRVEQQDGGEEAQQAAADKVQDALGEEIEIRRVEVVGPAVSGELQQAGIIAVAAAMIGILLYIWFRFEWQFGVAAILALVHDIVITVGLFALLGFDFGLSEVAALLTLAGYSINDSVVVFDRIRENLRRYKKLPLVDLLNLSINEMMSRTVITSTTTFLAVLALYVFGTEVIRGFSFAMLFGILIGTWSSIFIASPFLLWVGVKRDWSGAAAKSGTAAGRA
ncbi:MAG: protein translocase subunit SecF [Alphaproteobacteria bacterium]|jgi:preprotein translocase SecF subunit